VVLARELEADLLRLTDRYAAASERYRDLLVERPRRVQSRIGLGDAFRRLGLTGEAEKTLAQARELWAAADPEAKAIIK
jgi:predicted Zn-dependent protease